MRAVLLIAVLSTLLGCGASEQKGHQAPEFTRWEEEEEPPRRPDSYDYGPPLPHKNDRPGGLLADGGPDPNQPPCSVTCCDPSWFTDVPGEDMECCLCLPQEGD